MLETPEPWEFGGFALDFLAGYMSRLQRFGLSLAEA